MLRQLQIRNFALITDLDLEFEQGMTVLTGETGAGKSIVLDAISMLMGSRAYAEVIQTGAEAAWIAATFVISENEKLLKLLQELGFSTDDDREELILAREIHRSGRNKCWVNGRIATVGALRQIGEFLIEIHGQQEHQAVYDPRQYLEMVDAMGGMPLFALRAEVAAAYRKVLELERELEHLQVSEQDRLRRIDLLQFQIDEIAAAALTSGEEIELVRERELLRHGEKLKEGVLKAYRALYGHEVETHGALDGLGKAGQAVEPLVQHDSHLGEILALINAAAANVEEAVWQLREYEESLDVEPGRLDAVEGRLGLISRLERKYGESTEAILAYSDEISDELEKLLNSEVTMERLEEKITHAKANLSKKAFKLSLERQAVAKKLQEKIMTELPDLNLGHARFEVKVSQISDPKGIAYPAGDDQTVRATNRGVDHVEFLFSANPGEGVKPLARVASGGEASRLMLALKTVMAGAVGVPTLIFDEIDAGIGGKTARAIGAKLATLAAGRQVLCVTHLPQVAGVANHHLAISKEVEGESTEVSVEFLSSESRVFELARMLAGDGASEVSRQHARQLLNERSNF
ncbi:MAG: DNA repair protein RecN [Firmicutes bacterium]|nr:DNA repair protein RecN [Bacillota bacterium]